MATSQNGWGVLTSSNDGSLVSFGWVTGRVRRGDVLAAFDHLCRRFHAEVEPIRRDWSWGYAYRAIRGQSSGYSNHASGTAIDINAPSHPLGRRGTFSAAQVSRIHEILRDFDGAIRWGGDYSGRPDEMHFEINTGSARLADVVRGLNQEEDDMPYSDWPEKDRKALADDIVNALLTRDLYDDDRKLTVAKALQKAGSPPADGKS